MRMWVRVWVENKCVSETEEGGGYVAVTSGGIVHAVAFIHSARSWRNIANGLGSEEGRVD
jgi:hypothetical protein